MNPREVKEECEDFDSDFLSGDYDGGQKLKCGEIIFANNKRFCFTCLLCGCSLSNVPVFFEHILRDHLNLLNDQDSKGMNQVLKHLIDGNAWNEENKTREIPQKIQKPATNSNEKNEIKDSLLLEIEKLDFDDHFFNVKNEIDEHESGYDRKKEYAQVNVADIEEESCEFQIDDNSEESQDGLGKMSMVDENEESFREDEISKIQIEFLENGYNTEQESPLLVQTKDSRRSEITDDEDNDRLSSPNNIKINLNSNKAYICSECGKCYTTQSGLSRHLKSHQASNDFTCTECGKKFRTKLLLRLHKKRHENLKPYPCEICGANFADPSNLKVHIMRHKGIKPHACQLCEKSFHSTTELKLHMRAHTGEKPYICELCGQKFSNSGHLGSHKRRHFNERRFKCEICNKRFYDMKLLRDHSVSHTTERPFECFQCGATFQRRKALLQHEQLHSGVKRYTCTLCQKSFAQNAGLYSHMKSHSTGNKA